VPLFADTNLLVYARDVSERTKQPRAGDWMAYLWESREGRLSFQVLTEYYITVTQKLRPGLDHDDARADVRDLLAWRPVAIDARVLEGAWALERRFSIGPWDALIVAAARTAGCTHVLSEDLQHDQDLDGVRIANPFLVPPGPLA
jgi:predicted nucleic acid-binding protein